MRRGLLFLGWASLIASILDGIIILYALWLIYGAGIAALSMTVDIHLRDHLSFLYWVKDLAFAVLPSGFVEWIFSLPTIAYFSARMVVSYFFGNWLLSIAK